MSDPPEGRAERLLVARESLFRPHPGTPRTPERTDPAGDLPAGTTE